MNGNVLFLAGGSIVQGEGLKNGHPLQQGQQGEAANSETWKNLLLDE